MVEFVYLKSGNKTFCYRIKNDCAHRRRIKSPKYKYHSRNLKSPYYCANADCRKPKPKARQVNGVISFDLYW